MTNGTKLQEDTEADLLLAVGNCLKEWSQVERYLAELFHALFNTPHANLAPYVALDGVISFDSRLKMVDGVFRYSISDKYLLEIWHLLHRVIVKRQKKRNEIAHFSLAACDYGKDKIGVLRVIPYFSYA